MAKKHALRRDYPPRIERMIASGAVRPPQRALNKVLAEIGPRTGQITDAGTRALQEQRGDVV
jgi:hypothetical protein